MGQWVTWYSIHWSTSSTRNILLHLRWRSVALQNTWRSSILLASSWNTRGWSRLHMVLLSSSLLTHLLWYLSCFISSIRSGYNCVIYGWDPKCTMSQEWITTMRVHQLPNGANQPFYNVLVQDGTCRYAAQGMDHIHQNVEEKCLSWWTNIFMLCVSGGKKTTL